MKKADLVIWCCGYTTNQIPIYDSANNPINVLQKVENTQNDVNGNM